MDPQYLTIEVYNVGVDRPDRQQRPVAMRFQRLRGAAHTRDAADGCAHRQYRVYGSIVPTVFGTPETATIRISTNDPTAPFVDVSATGVGGTGAVATAIANSGSFGNVCLGSFVDEILTINNSGTCQLLIYDIAGSADFLAPSVVSYPLVVSAGASIDVVIRFQPSSFGPKAGTITIYSNDPASPSTVFVSGVAQAPKANLIIANSGNFGHVCVGSFVDEPLIVTNSGKCTLSVTRHRLQFRRLPGSGSAVLPDHNRARRCSARAHSLSARQFRRQVRDHHSEQR